MKKRKFSVDNFFFLPPKIFFLKGIHIYDKDSNRRIQTNSCTHIYIHKRLILESVRVSILEKNNTKLLYVTSSYRHTYFLTFRFLKISHLQNKEHCNLVSCTIFSFLEEYISMMKTITGAYIQTCRHIYIYTMITMLYGI